MITESWLKPYKTAAFTIPGFRLLHVDRSARRAGGVCMYVRDNLSLTITHKYTSSNVSAIWTALHRDNQPTIIYATVYHPPSLPKATCNATIDHIVSNISLLSTRYPNAKYVIYGDFNDLDTKPITDLFPLKQLVWFPTRAGKTIDLIFSDIDDYMNSPQTTCLSAPPIGRSDHNSIVLTSQTKHLQKYTYVKKRVITEKAKIGISTDIQAISWEKVKSESDPNIKAEIFQKMVLDVVDRWCPVKSIRVLLNKKPITTPLIERLKRAKMRAYRKGCVTWKYFSKVMKLQLAKLQVNQAEKNINNVTTGSKSWWHSVKQVTGERKSTGSAPYINIDDKWLDNQQFCEELNKYYVEIAGDVALSMPEIPPDNQPIALVTEWEVYHHLIKINTRKSTHSADYPSWVTRNNAEILAEPITDIINSILKNDVYPEIWKKADILPIPKVSSPKTLKEFRRISLLYHISKVVEKFMNRELAKHVVTDEKQYAYTKGIGTTDALVKVVSDIASALDRPSTYAIQALHVDFSKAFDLMRPDILAGKLISQGVPAQLIKLVTNFLSGRQQCVKTGAYTSRSLPTKLGVPQGTISGPILWNIYVNNLEPAPDTIKYADDTSIFTTISKSAVDVLKKSKSHHLINITQNSMQSAADKALDWSKQHHQRINAAKTQYMMFTLKQNPELNNKITMNNTAIEQSTEAKLLGVCLDSHLTFSKQIDQCIEKSRSAVHGLLTLRRHGVSSKMLVKFYQARILPVLSYAAPAWFTYAPQYAKDRLERHQSLCLRIIYPEIQSYSLRTETAGLQRITDHLMSLCIRYTTKIANNDTHRLHSLLPPRQSAIGRHSSRLVDKRQLTARTSLKMRSVFSLLE